VSGHTESAFPCDMPSRDYAGNRIPFSVGLSKRELFALVMFHAQVAAGEHRNGLPLERLCSHAIEAADTLLATLTDDELVDLGSVSKDTRGSHE